MLKKFLNRIENIYCHTEAYIIFLKVALFKNAAQMGKDTKNVIGKSTNEEKALYFFSVAILTYLISNDIIVIHYLRKKVTN